MKYSKIKKNVDKIKILCFVEYYLPGQRSGGPVRTISNFVKFFGDDYEIQVVCSDRDYLDDKAYPYKNFNKWHNVGKAKVFYINKKILSFFTIAKILNTTSYDILYLNGLFSFNFTILPLIIRKLKLAPNTSSCIIAPRGMLSKNALKLKPFRKQAFLLIVKFIGLYKNLIFQASNHSEKFDILKNIKQTKKKILIAPNLTTVFPIKQNQIKNKQKNVLKLVFLSRISQMKNLDFLLRSLLQVSEKIDLSIYGSKEDEGYYKKCYDQMKQLPKNINVSFKKHIKNELVQKTLGKYDLFVLPTLGENFGHVILESLNAGVPVLVSNKVFWKNDRQGGIQTLPLKEGVWAKTISKWSNYSNEKLIRRKKAALRVAHKYNNNNKSFELNKALFVYAFNRLDN